MARHNALSFACGRRVAAAAAVALLLAACGGGDDGDSGAEPRAGTLSFYTGERFAADPRHVANPEHGVLVVLRDPAQLGGRTGTALEQLGVDLVPYDFMETAPRTYCWDGEALQAAGAGAPHRMVLRNEARREVLEVVEGGPCVTRTIRAGRYTAVLHFGVGRASARDLVFLMPQREAPAAAPPLAAPPPGSAVAPLACPQRTYHSNDLGPGDVVVLHGGFGAMTVGGACGDIMMIEQTVPGDLDILAVMTAGPQTKVTLYSETGFRGKRWQITASGQFYDYNGNSDPQVRSFVPEVGTPAANTTTLITTNACKGCNLQAANLAGQNLKGAVLNDADFSRADLGNADLTGALAERALFASAHLAGTKLAGAVLTNAVFQSDGAVPNGNGAQYPAADLSDADLTGAQLDNAVMTGVTALRATFAKVQIGSADFTGANLTDASFESATSPDGSPPVFDHATMTRASLKNARLRGAFFRSAQMSPSNLGGADLAGAWMEADAGDPDGRPTVLAGSYMFNTMLAHAHMSKAVLSGVSWFNSNPGTGSASGAGALLTGANLDLADLPNLDLNDATLQGASMVNTQLINANLTKLHAGGLTIVQPGNIPTCTSSVNLGTANLRGATLTDADLSCAALGNAAISTVEEDKIYIEVLADPGRFQKPAEYQYLAVNRPATKLGGDASGGAVITDRAVCPSFGGGPCGPATGPNWVPPVGPQEPSNCVPQTFDADGNVTSVKCTSTRH